MRVSETLEGIVDALCAEKGGRGGARGTAYDIDGQKGSWWRRGQLKLAEKRSSTVVLSGLQEENTYATSSQS